MLLLALLLVALGATVWLARRDPRWGGIAASVVGLCSSAYLFSRKVDGSGAALCNVSDVLNCDVVNNSPASELVGLPIALMGVGWFGGLLFAGLVPPRGLARYGHVLGLGSALVAPWCVWLAIEAARLGAVCVLCLSIYASVAVCLVCGLRLLRAEGDAMLDLIPAVASPAGLVTAGTWLFTVFAGRTLVPDPSGVLPPDADAATALQGRVFRPSGPVRLDGDEPRLGRVDAPYLLVEFADFACPHCAVASQQVKALVDAAPDIAVAFRTYPLSGACNPMVEDTGPVRCHAAAAAECAHRQGRFWEYSSLLFENQTRLMDEDLRFMAEQAGLDVAAWSTCVQDPAAQGLVVADAMAGNDAGVMGTPSFFLRGVYGADFVQIERIELVPALVDAHRKGLALPEPVPAPHP